MSLKRHTTSAPSIASNLDKLLQQQCKFRTVYADPPWPYRNTASRAAVENHYATASIDFIRSQTVPDLVPSNAHLHLWTTNAFLREAFDVIESWGFTYKSCLLWLKPQLGMGNYWRVSHRFLLLGVRGSLTFIDRSVRSWHVEPRSVHSRKPFHFRRLIEQVSPGPYLELFGRIEQPNTNWTVFGNQVERRLFSGG